MIGRFLFVLLSALALAASARADSARRDLEAGRDLYGKDDFAGAAAAFDAAAEQAPAARLDRAVPAYNAGNALFRLERFDDAISRYQEALRTTDLGLQQSAYFNRGNALMQSADRLQQQQNLDGAAKSVDEALAMYEHAMALNPDDLDAKVNFELAIAKQREIEQQKQEQQQQQEQEQEDQKDEQQQEQSQDGQQDQQEQDRKDQQDDSRESQQDQGEQQDQQQDQREQQQQPQPQQSEQMTPEEARMILDSMKQDEQARRDQLRLILGEPVPVEKDW